MASRKRSLSNDSDMSALYKEWDEAACPICMDHPHNAVLLICSSHDKGCRSYICDTSYRHSNCLDRFKKLKEENAEPLSELSNLTPENRHDSINSSTGPLDLETWIRAGENRTVPSPNGVNSAVHVGVPGGSGGNTDDANPGIEEQEATTMWGRPHRVDNNMEKSEEWLNLKCPLCRGSVLGCKVVEDARKYLNLKSRSCSRESCSFFGSYRELRRHARRVHPTVRPADIDPSRQRAWHHLEDQREYNDIVSAIQSAMPGAVVFGDYVIENGGRLPLERGRGGGSAEGGRWLSTLFLFHMMGSVDQQSELRGSRPRGLPRHRRTFSRRRYLWGENLLGLQDEEDEDEEEEENEEPEMHPPSNLGDDASPNPRWRRRLTRAPSEEDQQ